MVHVTNAPRPLPEILSSMRPGDIITHCLHRSQYGIMGPAQERVLDEVWRAQQTGIIFDCAHGRLHCYFPSIRKAIAHGFLPNETSTPHESQGDPPSSVHPASLRHALWRGAG